MENKQLSKDREFIKNIGKVISGERKVSEAEFDKDMKELEEMNIRWGGSKKLSLVKTTFKYLTEFILFVFVLSIIFLPILLLFVHPFLGIATGLIYAFIVVRSFVVNGWKEINN